MRKLILIIALTAVPLGIWTAGCRNEQQAAFPDTPEMKSLAKSAETDDANADIAAAPVIPEKPVDRDILHYPDNGTLARVRAANDRAGLYASEKAGHGLFTLPEEENYVTAAAPAKTRGGERGAVAATVPAPSAREFWSRPVAERGRERSAANVPEDVSAMAGPARRGNDAVNPPAPARAPARSAREAFILPPDDMPGVFMAGEEDEPPEAPPPARRGWFGMLRRDRGDARGAPPASSKTPAADTALSAAVSRPRAEVAQRGPMMLDIDKLVGLDTILPPATPSPAVSPKMELTEQRFAAAAPEAFPPIVPGARIVSSEGMNFEPLPEPIPLSKYNSMVMEELASGMPGVPVGSSAAARASARRANERKSAPTLLPLPAALVRGGKPAAAPAIPELTETKTASKIPGAVEFAKVEKALAPLPDLASNKPAPGAPTQAKTGRKDKVVVSMPAPVPEVLPTPEAAAVKAALLEFSPEAMDEAFAELNKADFFKTDFWDPAAKTQMKADAEKAPAALPSLPELTDPAGPVVPMPPPFFEEETQARAKPVLPELPKPAVKKASPGEPKKVTLQPIRKTRAVPGLEKIDSATEVPPLKF